MRGIRGGISPPSSIHTYGGNAHRVGRKESMLMAKTRKTTITNRCSKRMTKWPTTFRCSREEHKQSFNKKIFRRNKALPVGKQLVGLRESAVQKCEASAPDKMSTDSTPDQEAPGTRRRSVASYLWRSASSISSPCVSSKR